MEKTTTASASVPASTPEESVSLIRRSWQDQPLPAPLISYEQAEIVAIGLLRQQEATRALVGASFSLVHRTLTNAGVSTTVLHLAGREPAAIPDVLLQTDPEGAARFDELHALVLCAPQDPDTDSATWLRNRRLAHLRLLALGGAEATVFLPDVDSLWQPVTTPPLPAPRVARWMLQASPALFLGGAALLAYIYNAGPAPALWPLFVLPLLGALGFGGYLFTRLSAYRRAVATAWLARPARLRPDSAHVASALARRPWPLLYLPVLLLLASFALLIGALATSFQPSLSLMLWPVTAGLLLLLVWAGLLCRRYVASTRGLVQRLPAALLPEGLNQLWQSYFFY